MQDKFFTVKLEGDQYYIIVHGVRFQVQQEFRIYAANYEEAVAQAHEMMLFEIERMQKQANQR